MIRRWGLSVFQVLGKPRASGDDPPFFDAGKAGVDVNPARAGMIRFQPSFRFLAACKPRASGDDPQLCGQNG